jgi:tetratricopeptide (TPR) repeat protein
MNMDERYGRNDPCPCGSGQKYKKCHGQVAPAQTHWPLVEHAPIARMVSSGTADVTSGDLQRLTALHAAGRFADLEQAARALAARNPTSGFVWKALGIALRMQSKDPLPALEKAAELLPTDPEAQGNLGVALLECNRVQEALPRFRRALALKPDYAEVHNMLGNVQLEHGRAEMAETCYRNAIAVQPSYVDAHQNLGNALFQQRRFEEAATSYRRALQLEPDNAEVHHNLGNVLMELRQTERAIESYRRASELKPQLAEAHGSLGHAWLQLGRSAEALASFQKALTLKPNDATLHSSLGNAHLQLRRPHEAAESYRRAIALQPDLSSAQANLGMALLQLSRFEEAVARFRRAIELRPNFAEAHNFLGQAWRSLGRYDEAVASHRAALAIKPDYAEAHNDLGIGLRLLGRTAEAEESCQRSLELNPNAPITLVTLAEAQADKGEFAAAEQLFQRALTLQPDLVQAFTGIAYVRKFTADDTAWREAAERLLQQPPLEHQDATLLHYALGKYFDDLQHYDEAFQQYQHANEIKKQHFERYKPEETAATIDAFIQIYSRGWIEQARPDGTASTRPVFIVGMPRSGTSLAEQILASHPQVFGAGELMFWSNAANASLARARRGEAVEARQGLYARDYLQLLGRLSADAQRVIDKMPGNFMHLGLLHAALPEARIIHMRRDPIDTCLSIYFQNFSGVIAYANDLHDLAHYYQQYRRIMQHWESVLPADHILDVSYEALVADPERSTRRMLEFIGLPWDARCLEFQQNSRSVVTTSRWQVRQKINNTSVARWRRYQQHLEPLMSLLQEPTAA